MTSLWILSVDSVPVQLCRSEREAVSLLGDLMANDEDEDLKEEDVSDMPYESGLVIGPYSIYELKVGKYYDVFEDEDDPAVEPVSKRQ